MEMFLISNQTLETNCVCCGVQWNNRKDRSYKDLGSKSKSFISSYQLLSKFGTQKIKLSFCDFCGNNLKDCTKITNKGILKIRNITTGMWRNATSVGVVV